MDIRELKNYICEYDKTEQILHSLGCTHIKRRSNIITCCNADGGDNPHACNVFLPSLSVTNYTRDLDTVSKSHDLFTLVQFYKGCDFFEALKYVCDVIDIDVYHDFNEDIPDELILIKLAKEAMSGTVREPDKPLSPIPEQILTYYLPCVNDQFLSDHISYDTQHLFELGYDQSSNRITIPIRNYDGTLVGVKGRYFGDIPESSEIQKYIYLEPCNKSQILYGLDKTKDKIEETHFAYVGESEKFVMQLWSYGDYNAVATGGKTISRQQIDLLSRLCDKVVLCLDSDVGEDELKNIADKFLGYVEVCTVVDENRLLVEKESPSDDPEKWKALKNQLKRIK